MAQITQESLEDGPAEHLLALYAHFVEKHSNKRIYKHHNQRILAMQAADAGHELLQQNCDQGPVRC